MKPTPHTGHAARRNAETARGRALAALTDGHITIWDLIGLYATTRDKHLGRITLAQLTAHAGHSPVEVARILADVKRVTGGKTTSGPLNITWLTDKKVGRARLAAYAAALQRTDEPWASFPYTPPPADLDSAANAWFTPSVTSTQEASPSPPQPALTGASPKNHPPMQHATTPNSNTQTPPPTGRP